ncbi:MAG TPA: bifunctional glycosyltransferase family 2 protein/CDP-glycerol:glycerophosphate glycerophosphotransferase [Micromonosporaceae bacterium]
MTLLSIVLPVYRVEGYLRESLDSILGQSFTDVEVIAVDDRSPDHSGEILAEYAARDPRLTVVSVPDNVGLGRARNAGLDRATGEYVWFVDSDDWLARGTLAAVARRLAATDADVLIFDHMRARWDGRLEPSSSIPLLAAAPDVFTLREWPAAIDILHVAWNKVVRRELLTRFAFRFESGWYEDVSFTYPLLAAAGRIAVLPRVCVYYRQRRVGAITRTVGDRHFEIFPHWRRAFALVDEWGLDLGGLRPLLFRRMIWHYLTVLGNPERVHYGSRGRFFAEAAQDYRRYLPAGGYPVSPGPDGVKQRLLARGRYRTFETTRLAFRGLRAARTMAGRARRAAARTARRARTAAFRGYYRLQLLLPMDDSLALYAAYWYRGYACNPAAIYECARELVPSVRGVWVVTRGRAASMPDGVTYVVEGSPRYYRALARARWLVNNVNWPNWVVKRSGSIHVMTHHGTPLKSMGLDQLKHPAGIGGTDLFAQLRRADRWDVSISANPFSTEVWARAFPCRYETLEVGYPRNDPLATATEADVAAARNRLGLAPGQTAVLYAPTYRDWEDGEPPVLDVEEFADQLPDDHVLLVRAHYFRVRAWADVATSEGRVIDVSRQPRVEDIYLASDVLITDYSSAMFDYAVLDRPIVIFAPDWEAYRSVRGVTFDLMSEPPGAVARDVPTLVNLFATRAYADDAAAKARGQFRARFCALEDGHAAERVVNRVFRSDQQ